MIDVKDSSEKSGSTPHGPAPAQRSRGRLVLIGEVFEVRFESRVPFQLCLGSKGELCVDRTGGRGGCSTRTAAHPPLLVCAWRAFGEPPGRRQGESFPPVGTRVEVGHHGVSREPSSSPGKRICVEQAGEGRGFGGEVEKALISQRGWLAARKRSQQKVKLSCYSLIYFT